MDMSDKMLGAYLDKLLELVRTGAMSKEVAESAAKSTVGLMTISYKEGYRDGRIGNSKMDGESGI